MISRVFAVYNTQLTTVTIIIRFRRKEEKGTKFCELFDKLLFVHI